MMRLKFLCLVSLLFLIASSPRIRPPAVENFCEIPVQVSSKVRKNVLASAVKVVQPESQAYGTGAYVSFEGKFLILTAAHVVENLNVLNVKNGYEVVLGTVIYKDDKADIAFLLVPKMRSRTPLKYKKTSMSELPGEPVIYAGYPNSHDLLLFFGRIAGTAEDSLIMHSYAWMGSSGSVVVDMKGRIVGVLTSVDVGMFYMPQIIEDVVWISSIEKVNDDDLRSVLNGI